MRRFRVSMVMAALLAGAMLLKSCDDGATLMISQVPRSEPDSAAASGTAAATNALAADLYRELIADTDDNLVFSPYSVAAALSMTRAGAAGETAAQMDAVLHADVADDLHAGMNAIEQALARRSGERTRFDRTTAHVQLNTANALWGDAQLEILGAFLDTLAAQYGAGMRLVDYRTNPDGARQRINAWVAEQTQDRIPKLLAQGTISPMTRLVLTNAIYFKAPWEKPFSERATSEQPFHRLDGTTVNAPLMRTNDGMGYVKGEGWQAVELMYAGKELSMVVVVPDAGEFEAFEAGLDGARLGAIAEGLNPVMVYLTFPRFEFRTQASLASVLSRLGMPIAFTERADFTLITTTEPLFISAVAHEAFIAVDEEGTEAAAATAVVASLTSAPRNPVTLVVDRPFIFFIRDVETGAVLFLGRVLDPTA
ncbi:MAG: serpin family protein [Planctomycetota bacterium]|jgi:serpin B